MGNESVRQSGSGLRKQYTPRVEKARVLTGEYGSNPVDPFGMFYFTNIIRNTHLRVMVGDGLGWDHVSVSAPARCPTWEEMKMVKELFFEDDCCVIQFHPPKSENINFHNFCLHLWHKQGCTVELPPSSMV